MVRQLIQVALDVAGRQRRTSAGEDGVDVIPRQQRAVVATRHTHIVTRLHEGRGHTREGPQLRIAHVDIVLRILEVVDIRGIVLCAAGSTRDQLGKLTRKRDVRGFLHVEEGYLVEHRREPLALLLPVHAQSPDGVTQRLSAHRHLRGQGLFVQMHQRATQLEVLRELVLPVHAHHRLALHAVIRVRLERHLHVGTGVADALVQDGHLAGRVIHRVVAALLEGHAASRHHHRSGGHVIGPKGYHVVRSALELSHEDVLVLLCRLLRDGLRLAVELREDVFLGLCLVETCCQQLPAQIGAEGFCRRQEHTTVAHGVTLHVVEVAVRMGLHVIVETVTAQQLQQRLVLHQCVGDIGQIHTGGVALELDVETELGLLYRRCEVVHVLHHQVPVALGGIVRGILQGFHEEGFRCLRQVAGKLAHLIGHATRCKLIGHGEHLVRLKPRLQRHVAQRLVHGVLRRCQQSGAGEFLVVHAVLKFFDTSQHRARLIDVARSSVVVHEGLILLIGTVARHRLACRLPYIVAHLHVLTEVCQGDDAAGVRGGTGLVRHPDFHSGDLDTRRQVRQRRHRLVVTLSEVVRQEEVAVLLILGHIDLEGCRVGAALRSDTLRRRFFLRKYRLQLQPAELHVRADTEQAGGALH